ncbi:MAG: cytochrome c-type biogenesis protein [Steroidobacteraceae bacterium]
MRFIAALAVMALYSAGAHAIDPAPPLADPLQQQRYLELIHELRCLKCQGETVADTQAMFAADIRRQVREMVQAGKSNTEVQEYMVDRYGEVILLKPRWSLANAWLWLAPGVFLLGGAGIAWRILRQRRALLAGDTSEVGEEPGRS